MKTGKLLLLLFAGCCCTASSVSFATGLKTLCRLPAQVSETSGIEVTGKNEVWTLNDSGGQSELYLCDTLGNLLRTVRIDNATNIDWEDLAQDSEGNFYIGDMGNNNNDRKNLCIYKIVNPKYAVNDHVEAQKIEFRYEDQSVFPPPGNNMNFDCESVVWFNHNIYLFSKNRSFPVKTSVYRIPDEPGNYIAKKIGTFDTGAGITDEGELFNYWVTSADISPDGKKLALLSHDRIWLFYNFTGDDFFGGQNRVYELESATQKESICFADDSMVYISDEYWDMFDAGRNLYRFYVSVPAPSQANGKFSLSPNPCHDKLTVQNDNLNQYQLNIYDRQGVNYQTLDPQSSSIDLNTSYLPAGLYLFQFQHKTSGSKQVEKLVKQ